MKTFYSHGKVLLSGEYVVLDGALALGLPTKLGQKMTVENIPDSELHWLAYDHRGEKWTEFKLFIPSLKPIQPSETNNPIVERIRQVFGVIHSLKPGFLDNKDGFRITNHLEFPGNWGLGSSSTLIANLSRWAGIDPYDLLNQTFGGSGYDIACALADGPVIYQKTNSGVKVREVNFDPDFKDNLYFLHLNRKQNSRESIALYKSKTDGSYRAAEKISEISLKLLDAKDFENFCGLLEQHESIISDLLGIPKVKDENFPDHEGSIKSLGGWGGDMVLVASENDPRKYFKQRGFDTLIPFTDLIL